MKKLLLLTASVLLIGSLTACTTAHQPCGCKAETKVTCPKDCPCGCHQGKECTCGQECQCAKHGTEACSCGKK